MARSRKRLSYKKECYYICCIVALTLILLLSYFGPGGYRDLQKARLDLMDMRIHVRELERDNNERMKTIEKLRSDKEALEEYAREKGYAKEGEIILRLSE